MPLVGAVTGFPFSSTVRADSVPVPEVQRFATELVEYFKGNHPSVFETIRTKGALPDGDELDRGLTSFVEGFDTGKVD